MSRIGKSPVVFSKAVNVELFDGRVRVGGSLGSMDVSIPKCLRLEIAEDKVEVIPLDKEKQTISFWGTIRSLIASAVVGVSEGVKLSLEVVGIGYRASVDNGVLVLKLGYSHDILYVIPDEVKITCPENNRIDIFGVDKCYVGQVAAKIKSFRKTEPYKGKGIKFVNEKIILKEGKKK